MDREIKILIIDDEGEGQVDPLDVARCFSNTPNVTIHVITRKNRKQIPLRHSRYIKEVHYFSPENNSSYLDNIIETIKIIESHVLFPLTIKSQIFISENINAFNGITKVVPISKKSVIEKVTNKWTLNELLRRNGFPYTKCLLFDNYQGIKINVAQLDYPLLLKPVISGGSGEGIHQFKNHKDLSLYLNSQNIPLKKIYLQEYINGYVLCVNILAKKGKLLVHSIHKGIMQIGRAHV